MQIIIDIDRPNSILISCVKGHAKQEDIDEGQYTPLLQLGNNKAYDLANKGVNDYVGGLLQLAAYCAAQQGKHTSFIKRIHAMFIKVIDNKTELCQEWELQRTPLKQIILGTEADHITYHIAYPSRPWSEGQSFDLCPFSDNLLLNTTASNYKLGIHTYLKNVCWTPTT